MNKLTKLIWVAITSILSVAFGVKFGSDRQKLKQTIADVKDAREIQKRKRHRNADSISDVDQRLLNIENRNQ